MTLYGVSYVCGEGKQLILQRRNQRNQRQPWLTSATKGGSAQIAMQHTSNVAMRIVSLYV